MKYSREAQAKIAKVMKEFEKHELRSGSGNVVTNRKQAIAIGMSEAREKDQKTPSEEE